MAPDSQRANYSGASPRWLQGLDSSRTHPWVALGRCAPLSNKDAWYFASFASLVSCNLVSGRSGQRLIPRGRNHNRTVPALIKRAWQQPPCSVVCCGRLCAIMRVPVTSTCGLQQARLRTLPCASEMETLAVYAYACSCWQPSSDLCRHVTVIEVQASEEGLLRRVCSTDLAGPAASTLLCSSHRGWVVGDGRSTVGPYGTGCHHKCQHVGMSARRTAKYC